MVMTTMVIMMMAIITMIIMMIMMIGKVSSLLMSWVEGFAGARPSIPDSHLLITSLIWWTSRWSWWWLWWSWQWWSTIQCSYCDVWKIETLSCYVQWPLLSLTHTYWTRPWSDDDQDDHKYDRDGDGCDDNVIIKYFNNALLIFNDAMFILWYLKNLKLCAG